MCDLTMFGSSVYCLALYNYTGSYVQSEIQSSSLPKEHQP